MSNKVNKSKTNAGKSVLPVNIQHKRPGSIEPTERDLKWCAAFCAVRNALWDLSATVSHIATESYNISVNARSVVNRSALIDYLASLDDRLQAAQSGMAGIANSAEEYIGTDLIRACGEKFDSDRKSAKEKMCRECDERYFYKLAKKLGKKVM